MPPARLRRQPKNIQRAVLVRVFGVSALRLLRFELGVLLFESIRDVFEKDQTKNDVLVLRGVHAAAQRIGHLPKLLLVADGCAVVLRLFFRLSHSFLDRIPKLSAMSFEKGVFSQTMFALNKRAV